ncbi:MAG: hypothetical protein GXP44_00045 [bacterium]|nr:hypothetical protein [bacterium]
MNFLGNLGIDTNLLIAQMINFGLLLWLLTKFLYKPVIRRIEKDEAELKQAQRQKAELELEKIAFAEREEREVSEAKKKIREIIKEAERIAEKIKKEAREEADKEAAAIIKLAKNKLESLKPDIEREISKKMKAEIGDSFGKTFSGVFSPAARKEIQNVFWRDFIGQLEKLTAKKLREPKLVEILKKSRLAAKAKGEKRNSLEKELEKIFAQKAGPVVLEHALPLAKEQEKELEEMISEKFGIKLKFGKKQNENLISGFRFEIAGVIFESNLLSVIKDAADSALG